MDETQHQQHEYIENFDWQKIACQVEEVYHEAIKEQNVSKDG